MNSPNSPILFGERAAIYRRVSTDHQDNSLELQEKRVLGYCEFRQLDVPPELVFTDPDTSGRIPLADRHGGGDLLRLLALGNVKHLVIAKLDRLGRNVRDALSTLEFLKARDVTLHIADFGGETISTQGHMGRLILTMLLAVAEWEVEEIRDRTRKTLKAKFNAGQLTGNVPFGFDCVYQFADGTIQTSNHALNAAELAGRKPSSKKLIANPVEQEVIRHMHQLRSSGVSLKAIGKELNRLGHRTKLGRPWQVGTVDSVLNSRYTQTVLHPLEKAA